MHLRRGLLGIITLLAATSGVLTASFPAPFSALPVMAQTSTEREAEAERLNKQGIEQAQTGQFQAALQSFQEALAIYREIGNPSGEANSLTNIGVIYRRLGKYYQALEFHQQALDLYKKLDDRYGIGITLNNIGLVYDRLDNYSQALEYYQRALAIYRKLNDYHSEGIILNNIGLVYDHLGNYSQALEYYQQALNIRREVRDYSSERSTLLNIGAVYRSLGQCSQALEFYQQALNLSWEIGDRYSEGVILSNIGSLYDCLGQYSQALNYYEQALPIHREVANLAGEGETLKNLGGIYWNLGQPFQALDFLEQALKILGEIGDLAGKGATLNSIGFVYFHLGEYYQAKEFYQKSLAIHKEIGSRTGEAASLSNLGSLLKQQKQPELAIIFYKQAVNVIETIRQDIQGLPQEQQQSYTETVADTYRRLADLLLKQDRILEAQRVLDLLKVQELDDYLHNVRSNDNTERGIAERNPERQIRQGTEEIIDEAIALGKELAQLESIKPASNRTPTQQQRIIELRKLQAEITQQFQDFLISPEVQKQLELLRQTTGGENFDLEQYANTLQDNLKRLQQDAVVLYPFILDDRLELVFVTPDSPPIRRTVNVKREELNQAILQFRKALQNPNNNNVQIPAQKLYNWLIKPLENDLATAEAKTIIYAPDGQLRYIPLAALYDGNQWLAERFRVNHITALSLTEFHTKPQSELQIFAAAFTQGRHTVEAGGEEFTFTGLPYAGVEVENLTALIPDTTKLLNDQFNQETVFLMNDYSVVHMATHAAFVIGQPEESFIVFGDGSHATLRDIADWNLPNVDLVVLSACETGLGDTLGDGKEILGFGYQMQRTKARAAIASLWQVSDGGTQALMNAFYEALQGEDITKAEALRQAQIALITGDYTALGEERGSIIVESISNNLPKTVQERLSHPYYWAPFILIGNGL